MFEQAFFERVIVNLPKLSSKKHFSFKTIEIAAHKTKSTKAIGKLNSYRKGLWVCFLGIFLGKDERFHM